MTRVKICGLTRPEDVEAAARFGADAIGVVLWAHSPRAVSESGLAALIARVPPFVTRVGVFVDATPDTVARIGSAAGLDMAQLHGDEDPAAFTRLGVRLMKSVALLDDAAVEAASRLPEEVVPIVDAADPVRRGGTGTTPDWGRAALLARRRAIVLAGGLRPDNVAEAIRIVRPAGVDVSSGVEDAPGRKNHEAMRAFVAAVRAAGEGT